MNIAVCIGNLTRDPEMRFTTGGKGFCKFDLAINRSYKDGNGEWVKETTFIPVMVWGPQAENCDRYLKKGSKAAISGRISIRDYEDRDGNKRKAFEIIADRVEFLNAKEGAGSPRPSGGSSNRPSGGGASSGSGRQNDFSNEEDPFSQDGEGEDDIPF